MKKLSLVAIILGLGLAYGATDFSKMTTEELLNLRGKVAVEDREAFRAELKSRLSQLSPQQKEKLGLAHGHDKNDKMEGHKDNHEHNGKNSQHQTNAEFFEKACLENGHSKGNKHETNAEFFEKAGFGNGHSKGNKHETNAEFFERAGFGDGHGGGQGGGDGGGHH